MDFLPKELEDIIIDYKEQLDFIEIRKEHKKHYSKIMKELKTKYLYRILNDDVIIDSVRYEIGDRVICSNRIFSRRKIFNDFTW